MKKLLLIFALISTSAFAQNVRWDLPITTVQALGGNLLPVYAVPGALISFYNEPAGTLANTYNSATSGSACPTGSQVVLNGSGACVTSADQYGNMGAWFLPGQYMATITAQGRSYNYYFTVGTVSGSGSGCGAGSIGEMCVFDGTNWVHDPNVIDGYIADSLDGRFNYLGNGFESDATTGPFNVFSTSGQFLVSCDSCQQEFDSDTNSDPASFLFTSTDGGMIIDMGTSYELNTGTDIAMIATGNFHVVAGVTNLESDSDADLQGNGSEICTMATGCGGGGGVDIKTNSSDNSSQSLLNMETSTANSVGLTITPSNPSGGIEKWEITGSSYTGTAANLSGTPALPNGTTATTQTVGDNTTKLATDAFVIANAGSGGISGLTADYIPLAGSSSTLTGDSPLDYGVTTAGFVTSSKPFAINDSTDPGFLGLVPNGVAPAVQTGAAGWGIGATLTTAGYYKFPDAPGTGIWHASNSAGIVSNTLSAVSLSADVSGNLPVTNLNSGTSASSSTFWRGDGSWAAAGGGITHDVLYPTDATGTPGYVVAFTSTNSGFSNGIDSGDACFAVLTYNGGTYSAAATCNYPGGPVQIFQGNGTTSAIDWDESIACAGAGCVVPGSQGIDVNLIKNDTSRTTVDCSTSGTAVYSQPQGGQSFQQIHIHFAACLGTASYTYNNAFTNAPSQVLTSTVGTNLCGTPSTTAVTCTGATTTGDTDLIGY